MHPEQIFPSQCFLFTEIIDQALTSIITSTTFFHALLDIAVGISNLAAN